MVLYFPTQDLACEKERGYVVFDYEIQEQAYSSRTLPMKFTMTISTHYDTLAYLLFNPINTSATIDKCRDCFTLIRGIHVVEF